MKDDISVLKLGITGALRVLLMYVFIIWFCGVLKSGLFLAVLRPEIIATARIASYITIVITGLMSGITLVLLCVILYFVNDVFDFGIEQRYIIILMRYPILVFIIIEFVRLFLAYYFLPPELNYVSSKDISEDVVANTFWYRVDIAVRYCSFLLSGFVYIFALKQHCRNIDFSTFFLVFVVWLGLLFFGSLF